MKNIIYLFLLVLPLIFVSCEDDVEEVPDVDVREAISKKWLCSASDGTNNYNYEVTISADPNNENKIIIDNFNNLGTGTLASADISGNYLTFSSQSITSYYDIVSGTGDISNNYQRIELQYVLDDKLEKINVSATLTPATISKKMLQALAL